MARTRDGFKRMLFVVLLAASMTWAITLAQEPTDQAAVQTELHQLLADYYAALQHEDAAEALKHFDPNMRSLEHRRRLWNQTFQVYELAYTLEDFKVLAVEDDLAIARYHCTVKNNDPKALFKDNRFDSLQIYRHRDGQWLMHEQVILDYVELPAEATPESEPDKTQSPAPAEKQESSE